MNFSIAEISGTETMTEMTFPASSVIEARLALPESLQISEEIFVMIVIPRTLSSGSRCSNDIPEKSEMSFRSLTVDLSAVPDNEKISSNAVSDSKRESSGVCFRIDKAQTAATTAIPVAFIIISILETKRAFDEVE